MIHKAIEFAAIKHRNQNRKGTDTPYIVHPMEVYGILASCGCEEETLVGGILHDTLEDTDTEIEELISIFGTAVAELVASESEDKSKTWKQRKQATIESLKTASLATKQIACADKLSNLISMYADLQICGDSLWQRFSADKSEIAWYYISVIESLKDLSSFAPYVRLKKYFDKVFK